MYTVGVGSSWFALNEHITGLFKDHFGSIVECMQPPINLLMVSVLETCTFH